MPIPDLKRLRVFREVARHCSFSAAADALNYSQPAVSHHVSRLELEVGARLLVRSQREGITLTEAGRVLLKHANALLDQAAEAEVELASLIGAHEAEVRVGAFASASATIVAEAIGNVRRQDPAVRLTLLEGEASDTIDALKGRRIDVGVVFDDPDHQISSEDGVELQYLLQDPMLLALPCTHPQACEERVSLEALREERWIQGAGEDTPASLILVAACQAVGFEPRVAFNSGNFQVVQQLVAAGVGVALIPELAIVGELRELAYRRIAPTTPYRRVAVALRRGAYLSPSTSILVAELAAACRRRGATSDARWAPRNP